VVDIISDDVDGDAEPSESVEEIGEKKRCNPCVDSSSYLRSPGCEKRLTLMKSLVAADGYS